MKEFNIGKECEGPIKVPADASTVSRQHARIKIDGDNWTLEDTDSANGTFVLQNGKFMQVAKVNITPNTWIRLGSEGHTGLTFKARRVIFPNDYHQDFEELRQEYEEYTKLNQTLEERQNMIGYVIPALSLLAFLVSFLLPDTDRTWIMAGRGLVMLPGLCSKFITKWCINSLNEEKKAKAKSIVCPKCRSVLSEYDVRNGRCSKCRAQ